MAGSPVLTAPAPDLAQRPSGRSFLPDLLKATGCLLIVLHHMAFYGPMAHVVSPAWPAGIDWLAQYGRLAVQVFLVCSGFLAAQSLAAMPALSWQALRRTIAQRYLRLAIPLLAALSFTVLVSELIRPGFVHDSLSATPDWTQALAHLFFLQHLLDLDALSAGVWYVAVDLQLFASALLLLWLAQKLQTRIGGRTLGWQTVTTGVLVVLSLTVWTHEDALDDTALFFWGAYGMGWLAWQARKLPRPAWRWALLLALGALCLAADVRFRALTAWASTALLMVAPSTWLLAAPRHQPQHQPHRDASWRRAVSWLSQISYAVFVLHFGVCLLVNFGVQRLWPQSLAMNALGMFAALGLSLLAGHALHRWTERGAASWARWMEWATAFMASAGLAMWLAP